MCFCKKNLGKQFLLLIGFIFSVVVFANPLYQPTHEPSPLLQKRIENWVQKLSDDTDKQAVANLKKIGNIATPKLLDGVKSKNPMIKRKSLEILRDFYVPELLPFFREIWENETEDPRNREIIGLALGKYIDESVLDSLEKYTTHADPRIQRAAGYSICSSDTSIGIPYLIRLLKHWNTELQNLAYKQLRVITKQRQFPAKYEIWAKWWEDYQEIWDQ